MQVLVSIGKVAETYKVTTQTIRNWVKEGKLQEYRTPGGHRRFDLEEINAIKLQSLRKRNKKSKNNIVKA